MNDASKKWSICVCGHLLSRHVAPTDEDGNVTGPVMCRPGRVACRCAWAEDGGREVAKIVGPDRYGKFPSPWLLTAMTKGDETGMDHALQKNLDKLWLHGVKVEMTAGCDREGEGDVVCSAGPGEKLEGSTDGDGRDILLCRAHRRAAEAEGAR